MQGRQPLSRVRGPPCGRCGAGLWTPGLGLAPAQTSLAQADHLPCPPADLNGMAPELPVAVPSGPFRNVGLSKAARTHRLRKLRTPAKCRECNSYVYFQGAECEEVRAAGSCRPRGPRRGEEGAGRGPGQGLEGGAGWPGGGARPGRRRCGAQPGGETGSGGLQSGGAVGVGWGARSRAPPAVLPGLSQEVPGHAGHPVWPQETPGPPAALRPGLLEGGLRRARRHPLHRQEVRLRDRAAGTAHQGDRGGGRQGFDLAGGGAGSVARADGRPRRASTVSTG